jgi:hypothetical protein
MLDDYGNDVKLKNYSKYNRPLILEVPRYINDYVPAHLIAVGNPNTEYKISFVNNKNELFSYIFKTDNAGNYIRRVTNEFPYGNSQLVKVETCKGKCRVLTIYRSVAPRNHTVSVFRDVNDIKQLTERPDDITIRLLKNNVDSFPIFKDGVETTVNNGIIGF